MDTNRIPCVDQKPATTPTSGYTSPIARSGEQQFACVLRNRSGESSGDIDFGARSIKGLSYRDQRGAIEAAYSVYLKWCSETGEKSIRDDGGPV